MEAGGPLRAGHVWLAALLLLPAAGAPLLVHPAFRPLSRFCRAGLSAGVGAVLVSTLMTWCAFLRIPWSVPALAAGAACVAALLRFLLRAPARDEPPHSGRRPTAMVALAAVAAAAAVAVALDATATGAATSVDLLLLWGPKAQAFAAARTIDAGFLATPALDYMNRSYPPLVTNLYAFATMAAGGLPWGAATLCFPLLLGALALSLPGLLARATRRDLAAVASALVIAVIAFLGVRFEIAGNGDMPLWIFEALAVAALSGPFGKDRAGALLSGLFLAGAATAKVEGLPFAAASLALYFLTRRRRISLSDVALLTVPGAAALGSWFLFGASRGLFLGFRGFGRPFEIFPERLSQVLATIGAALASASGALPFLLPALFLAAVGPRRRGALLPLGVAAVLCGFFLFTYLHGGPDPKEWIFWTAGRIFAPVAFLLVLSAAAGGPPPDREPEESLSRTAAANDPGIG